VTKFHGRIDVQEQISILFRAAFREATTGSRAQCISTSPFYR